MAGYREARRQHLHCRGIRGRDGGKIAKSCRDIVLQDITTWRAELTNSFEASVYDRHPRLRAIKDQLYDLGAIYAQMSGSGSAHFGIFRDEPTRLADSFPADFVFACRL